MSLSSEESAMLATLKEIGQAHLLESWDQASASDQKRLLAQCVALDKTMIGGLKGYAERARKLLQASRVDANPYDGYVPSVPPGLSVSVDSKEGRDNLDMLETLGLQEVGKAAFVLVAGGLGERLGYNGIKVELPVEICTETCYLDYYCQCILAFQDRARALTKDSKLQIPLAIMTSGDTHAKTVALLEANKHFGMAEGQITIVKQELVPSMGDNEARFVTEEKDKFALQCKPHGHGDVHALLHTSGLAARWAKEKKWVVFFQDTNALVFKALLAALGCSSKEGLAVNSVTVPRAPGEAMGAITRLTKEEGGQAMTINVEYNQLSGLLSASGVQEVKDSRGYSQFPGNINVLIFDATLYGPQLAKTQGLIAEFVNPKYADAEKTKFKKPTRLECMMQDYPKELDPSVKVGFTTFPRWMAFSAVKNNIVDAAANQKTTGSSGGAAEGEDDYYELSRAVLRTCGVELTAPSAKPSYAGVSVQGGAKIVFSPAFAVTQAELRSKFKGKNSIQGALIVQGGGDVTFENVTVNGTLVIKTVPGVKLRVHDLEVNNKGWEFTKVEGSAEDVPEKFRIRGYTLKKEEQMTVEHTTPGEYTATKSA